MSNIEFSFVGNLVNSFINFIYQIIKGLRIRIDGTAIEISVETEQYVSSLDERIAKLDLAKANLIEGLNAIDELKHTAELNKKEVEIAVHQISQLENDKSLLQKELESIKVVVQSDVNAFRKVAGVLGPAEIRRERLIGFISGVIASLTASGIIWAVIKIIKAFYPDL
ncbi:MAG: hypothetical protein IAF58_01305 [Leptolyngbya sp.]|nr:hypothetical protein [Candidatus Melainabacteria bacterium]